MNEYKKGMHSGEIKAWCEAARNEAKPISLSAPFTPEEHPILEPLMIEHAENNQVNYYLEKSLIETDLFTGMDLSGIWVYIIYKNQETLEKYLELTRIINNLQETNNYNDEKRREIALTFGRLLGYSDECINNRWC